MTQGQLVDILIARLVQDHGRTRQHWRRRIGTVRLYSTATHAHCNWALDPTGSTSEIAVIERLIDDLRMNHPILTADR